MILANLCSASVTCQIVESGGEWAVTVVPHMVHMVGRGGSLQRILKFPQSELRVSLDLSTNDIIVTGRSSGDVWRVNNQQQQQQQQRKKRKKDDSLVVDAASLFTLEQCAGPPTPRQTLVLQVSDSADSLLNTSSAVVLDGATGTLTLLGSGRPLAEFPPSQPLLLRRCSLSGVDTPCVLGVTSEGTVLLLHHHQQFTRYSLGCAVSSASLCGDQLLFTALDGPLGPLVCTLREPYDYQGSTEWRFPSFLSWRALAPHWGECAAVGASCDGLAFAALTQSGDLLEAPLLEGGSPVAPRDTSVQLLMESIASLSLQQRRLQGDHAAINAALFALNEALCLYAERASLQAEFQVQPGVSAYCVSLSLRLENRSSVRVSPLWSLVVLAGGAAHSLPLAAGGLLPGCSLETAVNPLQIVRDGFLMAHAYLVLDAPQVEQREEQTSSCAAETRHSPAAASMVVSLGSRRFDLLELSSQERAALAGDHHRSALQSVLSSRAPPASASQSSSASSNAFHVALRAVGPAFQLESCAMFAVATGEPFRILCREDQGAALVDCESRDEADVASLRAAVLIRAVKSFSAVREAPDGGQHADLIVPMAAHLLRVQRALAELQENPSEAADAIRAAYQDTRRLLAQAKI